MEKIYGWSEITNQALPEFDNLNEANTKWLWGIVRKNIEEEEITYETINEKVKELYGEELNIKYPKEGMEFIKYNEETIQPMLIIGIILKVLGLEDEAHNENKYILYFCHQNALLLNPLWNNSSKYSLPYKIYLLMFFKTILSVIHCNTTY